MLTPAHFLRAIRPLLKRKPKSAFSHLVESKVIQGKKNHKLNLIRSGGIRLSTAHVTKITSGSIASVNGCMS